MKNMKKLFALAIALVMVLALSATAFAATNTNEGTLTIDTNNEITFKKEIVILNSGSSAVWEPNISYTYSITPVTGLSNVTVTDNSTPAVTNVVKDGIANGLLINDVTGTTGRGTSATIVFGNDTGTAAQASSPLSTTDYSSAETAERTLYLSVDTSVFVDSSSVPVPGIYRYKISEALASGSNSYAAAGVTQGSYSADRYVDVYLKWADTTMTSLELYGLTMFTTSDSIVYDTTNPDATFKVTGYDVATEGSDVDVYKTYNLTVEKEVAGALADKNHAFPFTVALAESTATAVEFYATGDSYTNADLTFTSSAWSVNTTYGNDLKLKHGQSFNLIGLPLTTTATIGEKDDTVDVYTAAAVDVNNTTSLTLTNDSTNKTWTTTTDAVTVGNPTGADTAKTSNTVTFTNTLAEISPTGVVLRVAPYALILGFGFALLMVTRRRKEQEEA